MNIKFNRSIENPPPKSDIIIGVFMRDGQTFIDFCHYDCEAHIWVLHHFSMKDFGWDPILWTDKKKFKKTIYDTMYKEIQEQK